jgi:hypothetical protein
MSGAERLAVIEVGTRGIRLLVAERRELPQGMAVLRTAGDRGNLGEGLETRGEMARENIQRSLQVVSKFLGQARSFDPGRILLVGTDVFRRARNVDDFKAGLSKALQLQVLAPQEEAAGAFLAAGWGFRDALAAGGWLTLVDLGGGSTEVVGGVQASPPRPQRAVSMNTLGAMTLRTRWQALPEGEGRAEALRQEVAAEVERHAAVLDACRAQAAGRPHLVAGLGSTTTESAWVLAGRARSGYSSDKVHGLAATTERLRELHRALSSHDRRTAERTAHKLGIEDPLTHQLGLGALLAVLDRLQAPSITACGYGLRFGLAYAHLHGVLLALTAPDPLPPAPAPEPVSTPAPVPAVVEAPTPVEPAAAAVTPPAAPPVAEAPAEAPAPVPTPAPAPAPTPDGAVPAAASPLADQLAGLLVKDLKAVADRLGLKIAARARKGQIIEALLAADSARVRAELAAGTPVKTAGETP